MKSMEEQIYESYARHGESAHINETEEEPTFLKSLRNLIFIILVLGIIMILGTITIKYHPKETYPPPESLESVQLNDN